MQRVTGSDLIPHRHYFQLAAEIAQSAQCHQARCGAVIVRDGNVIGSGFNGPPLGKESNRTCGSQRNVLIKPKYDKTCCIHAEWRAILNACKAHPDKIVGSTLYFMRIDDSGNFTDAGVPYCTDCSRLTMESGVGYFALWNKHRNDDGMDLYTAEEYDRASYAFSDVIAV